MDIIELHSDTWLRLQDRRSQLPHSLLLSGARGVGKFDLARRFAASLLCEAPLPNGNACKQCVACKWLSQGNHPDFRLLQPEALAEADGEDGAASKESSKKASQQITIDQVRALDDFLHVGTHRHGLRIILVCPAEAMNRNTANALLKTLEEPAAGTHFLLVSDEPARLLPTIRSRCQSVAIPLPNPERSSAWLSAAGVSGADRWLALAGGAPLLAAELGTSSEKLLIDALIKQLVQGAQIDPIASATALDKVIKSEKGGTPMKRTMEWAQKWLFDLSLGAAKQPARYFVSESKQMTALVAQIDQQRLLAFVRKALQYKRHSEHPLNSRLFLEDFFMGYASLFNRH